jgi:hypothetical protein
MNLFVLFLLPKTNNSHDIENKMVQSYHSSKNNFSKEKVTGALPLKKHFFGSEEESSQLSPDLDRRIRVQDAVLNIHVNST